MFITHNASQHAASSEGTDMSIYWRIPMPVYSYYPYNDCYYSDEDAACF